jgi:hypothetical protein
MHIIIWRFRVATGRQHEFVKAYRSNGDWAKFFSRSHAYLGTELLQCIDVPTIFYTIDRWESREALLYFHDNYAAEYERLRLALRPLFEDGNEIGL